MGRRIDKIRKESTRKESTSTNSTATAQPKVVGCHVPDPIVCTIGCPVSSPDEGVLMECSNVQCPFKGQRIHQCCFKEYEDHLIKKISTMGSARGWTEQQRRANIWEKKGQSLIAKQCRCRCGLGTTKRDEMAHYNKTLQETAALRAAAESTKRKHVKSKQLPHLNFPRGPPTKAERRLNSFGVTDDEDDSFTYRREPALSDYRTNSIASAAATMADFEDSMSTCSRNEVFENPLMDLIVPAPLPTPLTRSYAAAICNKTEICLDPHPSPALTNGFNDSGLESKGESPLFSSASKHDSNSSISSDDAITVTPMRPIRRPRAALPRPSAPPRPNPTKAQKQARKASKTPPQRLKKLLCDNVVEEDEQKKSDRLDVENEADTELDDYEEDQVRLQDIAGWCPMFGRGLNYAEQLIANYHLPGLLPRGNIE